MVNEHERALGGWQAEWDCLPEIACLCGAALTQIRQVLEGLHVDTERMRANIDQTRGLVMAEAVSLALAAHIGRAAAHECIEAACHAAQQSGQTLHRILSTEPLVLQAMSLEELEAKFDPLSYTGSANLLIDRVLVAHRASEA
jgi:3-carboxy-cis,cis-muconate cycloisomerase